MGAAPKHRNGIVQAAVALFRKRGYAATGINDILLASGAPKGSFYHYFPAGKEQLGEEALALAAARVSDTLRELCTTQPNTASVVRAYGELLAGWMEKSDFSDGSPITTTLLETTPQSAALTHAGRTAFRLWREQLAAMLGADGIGPDTAASLASLVVSAWEGALIQTRVEGSRQPISDASEHLAALIERHLATTA